MNDARTHGDARSLLSTAAVRERCGRLLDAARGGRSRWFELDEARLDDAADLVAEVTRRRYPTLAVPYHSRWRHFEAGGADRVAALEAAAGDALADPAARARARIDLAVVSVLLDAGAGGAWRYHDRESGTTLSRSEGLGVATLMLREVEIECLPDNLVSEIDVDLSTIRTPDDVIHVKDLVLPRGVEILTDPDQVVARFEYAAAEEEELAGEEGAGADAVEVITKGKKDEEEF